MHSSFREFLKTRLSQTLPGSAAQNKMRPLPASSQDPTFMTYTPSSKSFKNSCVLVLFTTWHTELHLLLTLRTSGIKHGGQISFPGGGREGNETFEETALREAYEETGVNIAQIETVGTLTPLYIAYSDNMVVPVVGFLDTHQHFVANPNEVEEIFSVPISKLVGTSNLRKEEWIFNNIKHKVPFWDVHRVPLWGGTSMMLSELVVLYEEFTQL